MPKPSHVVVFDFDGTMISKKHISCFTIMDNSLEPKYRQELDRLRHELLPKINTGQLTPEETRKWIFRSIEIYIESGLTLFQIRKVFSNIKLRDRVIETLQFLHKQNIPTAIVSYGIKQFIEAVLEKNGVQNYIDHIYAVSLVTNMGLVCAYKPETLVFTGNKGRFSFDFAMKHGVWIGKILAVGDSAVDCELGCFQNNRLGIAQDEEEKLKIQKYFGEVMVTEDFGPVLEWLKQKLTK